MLEPQTGKGRAQRIKLDYYKKPSLGLRWKRYGSVAAFGFASILAFVAVSPRGARSTNTGPLSRSHAALESDCLACHTPFQPLATDAFLADSPHHRADAREKCETCHPPASNLLAVTNQTVDTRSVTILTSSTLAAESLPVAGHFESSLNPTGQLAAGCIECHREHRGFDINLSHVDNDLCSSCHRDVSATTNPADTPAIANSVSAFTLDEHPQFTYARDNASDPGRIYFDHRQHMQPGQVDAGDEGGLTKNALPVSSRERYDSGPDGLIRLGCGDCHVPLGPSQTAIDVQQQRTFAPIDYESHCAACHELNFPLRDPNYPPVPHAASWQTVDGLLRGLIASQLVGAARDSVERRDDAIPGTQYLSRLEESQLQKLDQLVDDATESLQSNCLLCHQRDDITAAAIEQAGTDSTRPLIPAQWLQRGSFNHAAHRQLDCRRCHEAAFPNQGDIKLERRPDDELVMIAGMEVCIECHRPADKVVGQRKTGPDGRGETGLIWAGDECTMCHRYHWTRTTLSAASLSPHEAAATGGDDR